jgi:hypothetical protein
LPKSSGLRGAFDERTNKGIGRRGDSTPRAFKDWFPYGDLDDAFTIAKTIWNRAGQQASTDQLAAWLEHESVAGGDIQQKF